MIPINGLHVEPTNICTLKCSACARTEFISRWPQHWKNHNLNIQDFFDFLDIDIAGLKINFCGNYGDPIYHPEFLRLVRETKNRGARVSITTNGSYKKPDWWQELSQILKSEDSVRFSIDGLPHNFTEYRVNADWDSIEQGIKICRDNGVHTIWKYIPFVFNQHHIDNARSLSKDLGMEFLLDPSDRYDDRTIHLMPAADLVASRKSAREADTKQVNPKCYHGRDHFITATGHYSPCCFVADHRFYYKTQFGRDQNAYEIKNSRLSQLLARDSVVSFFDSLESSPPSVCHFNCPKT